MKHIFSVSPLLPEVYNHAALIAEQWLTSEEARRTIRYPSSYTCTKNNPSEIADYILAQAHVHRSTPAFECHLKIMVIPWYKRAIYRNTVAEHSYGTISFTKKFLKRDLGDVVNTIVHEYMHYIGFQHNGNSPTQENLKSVPYMVGSLAEAFVRSTQKGVSL